MDKLKLLQQYRKPTAVSDVVSSLKDLAYDLQRDYSKISGAINWLIDNVVYRKSVVLSQADLASLFSTAKQIIPPPGIHSTVEIIGCELYWNYGSSPTSSPWVPGGATNLTLKYTNKSGLACTNSVAVAGFLDQNSEFTAKVLPIAMPAGAASVRENQPVVISLDGADMVSGGKDGTLTVETAYIIHNTGF